MTQEEKDKEFIVIKCQLMDEQGYDEEDMDDDSIEGDINAEARDIFYEKFNEEYYD